MTTKPKWTEIKTNLEHGQQAHDRPELDVCVFKQNLCMLMELLKMEHLKNYKLGCIPPSFRNGAFLVPIFYYGLKENAKPH